MRGTRAALRRSAMNVLCSALPGVIPVSMHFHLNCNCDEQILARCCRTTHTWSVLVPLPWTQVMGMGTQPACSWPWCSLSSFGYMAASCTKPASCTHKDRATSCTGDKLRRCFV